VREDGSLGAATSFAGGGEPHKSRLFRIGGRSSRWDRRRTIILDKNHICLARGIACELQRGERGYASLRIPKIGWGTKPPDIEEWMKESSFLLGKDGRRKALRDCLIAKLRARRIVQKGGFLRG